MPGLINSDFPFNFINGISAHFGSFPETLLHNSGSIIQNIHLNFKMIPAGSAYRAGRTAKKSIRYVENALFATSLAYRRRWPPFLQPDFQQLKAVGSAHPTGGRPRQGSGLFLVRCLSVVLRWLRLRLRFPYLPPTLCTFAL